MKFSVTKLRTEVIVLDFIIIVDYIIIITVKAAIVIIRHICLIIVYIIIFVIALCVSFFCCDSALYKENWLFINLILGLFISIHKG